MSSAYVATNNGYSTLAADITTSSQTTITLAAGHGARFPSPTGGDYTLVTIENAARVVEIVSVVGRSTDTLTVGVAGSAAANAAGRGMEGTTATTWLTGNLIECRATAAIIVKGGNAEATANKDATGGYAGLTLFKLNLKNAANTFTNFFTNATTAARTWTMQDRNGTIADDTDLATKAGLAGSASQAFSMTTAAQGTNTTQGASTAFVINEFGKHKNYIINGGFDIWQSGVSFSGGGVYTADRWKSVTDATVTTSRQSFTPGDIASQEGDYFLRSARTATGTYQYLEQRIENVRTLAGKPVTCSFWAKADSGVTYALIIIQNFGSGGSASADTPTSSVTLTTAWVEYSVTVTLPAITGKTIGANNFLALRAISIVDAAAHTVDMFGVQLEEGSVATQFEALSYGEELRRCRRYCRVAAFRIPATTAQNLGVIDMRAVPTITGGGAGFTSTGTTADTLIAFQTTGATATLTLASEL
jgi:hypothetical protein